MVYIDADGNAIEKPDLTAGYLIDVEWIDYPAQEEKGHYEYQRLQKGGVLQTYVVDVPAQEAKREVTKQQYIPYPPDDGRDGLEERVASLEETVAGYETAYQEGVESA